MKPLFDFGISQEDDNAEQIMFDLQPNDRVLCIASGGEVPLNLLCRNKDVRIEAIDISETQLALCRLKLSTALYLDAPGNASFLGYSKMSKKIRKQIFLSVLLPTLSQKDKDFWLQNLKYIERGVINYGRFELFIKKVRNIGVVILGKKNIEWLINCSSIQQQKEFFNDKIAKRKLLKYVFKIAFHPLIYKKRGLDERGLIHATSKSGDIFFEKFKDFCTATQASDNYFFQYYITGNCTPQALPDYLRIENKQCLKENTDNILFEQKSITEVVNTSVINYNKIHLSNIGDWMIESDFRELMGTIQRTSPRGTKISCRVLQKNHFANGIPAVDIDKNLAEILEKIDRFPFYSLFPITVS